LQALSLRVVQADGHLVDLLVDLVRLHVRGQAELDKPGLSLPSRGPMAALTIITGTPLVRSIRK
jgi:hypothetical protein